VTKELEKAITEAVQLLDNLAGYFEEFDSEVNGKQRRGVMWARSALLEAFDAQKAEERRGGWIACSDRMPEPGVVVLYMCKFDDQPQIGERRKLDQQWYWGSDSSDYDHQVTHWQPLPAPPR
jgi:hypothetical protein